MTDSEIQLMVCDMFSVLARERAKDSYSERAERLLKFNEPGRVGNFSLHGREYLREPLDNYGIDEIHDQIICMGTRCGKTTVLYAGTALRILEKARRVLYVKPTTQGTAGARGDAKTRFIPMCMASPELRRLIPTGALRHNFTTAQQMFLNGSIVDWTGSNSVANLASNSMEDVNQDEVDKFNTTKRRDDDGNEVEADASDLADERTGEFKNPKRVKASTPTLPNGRIWTELLKTDLRRRFVPCPLCGRDHPKSKLVILAWSEQFTILPKVWGIGGAGVAGEKLPLAYAQWDREAKRPDGTWDYERVEKSAGYLCPHCGKRFRDDDKLWQDQNGIWQPTQRGALRSRGYHLPSMYAMHDQCSAGKMAVQFLEAVKSIEGPRNIINSKFAEAYAVQGVNVDRKGVVGRHIEVSGEWLKVLSVDCQEVAPYFWTVVRAWNGSDKTHGIEYQSVNQWTEVDAIQEQHKIIPEAVIVDVGFNQAEALRECSNMQIPSRCRLEPSIQNMLPEVIGWTPAKAFGGKRYYPSDEEGRRTYQPYRLKKDTDPWAGTNLAKSMRIELLEWLNDIFEDMLENIRSGQTGLAWSISTEMDTEEYHRHMAGTVRDRNRNNPRDYKWRKRSTDWPDHLRACERLSLVHAYRLKLISFDAIQPKQQKEPNK